MAGSPRFGYDPDVASPEDVRAREVLRALEERLVQGPYAALGISANANPAEIRHAFFELAKIYHPAKFARMATDIQKQSNEVFLALRAAHDVLTKTARQASQQPQRPSAPVMAGPTNARPTGQHVMPPQPGAPSGAHAAAQPPRAMTNAMPPVVRPPAPPATPAARPPSPSPDSSQTMKRAGTPASGVKVVRTPTPAVAAAPAAAAAKPAVVGDDVATIVDLLQKQKWDEARSALHNLAAKAPSDPKIRALLAYTDGRQAQLRGDVDEARVELNRALMIDPELQLAKTALGELFARRK
jgi:DnaJ-like protein